MLPARAVQVRARAGKKVYPQCVGRTLFSPSDGNSSGLWLRALGWGRHTPWIGVGADIGSNFCREAYFPKSNDEWHIYGIDTTEDGTTQYSGKSGRTWAGRRNWYLAYGNLCRLRR